jgi:transmembrane 9 superfamily protein 2/4
VNKVYSDNTQLQYAYYDLPFVCPPDGKRHAGNGLLSGQSIPLNIGEVLRGDRIVVSDIQLSMAEDSACNTLCTRKVTRDDLQRTKEMIADGYVAEWIVDNLPGATSFVTVDKTKKYYASGFKLGYSEYSTVDGKTHYYLNNHHTIVLRYREAPGRAGERGEKVIVAFEVYPKSIGPDNKKDSKGCAADMQNIEQPFEVTDYNKTLASLDGSSSHSAGVTEGDDEDDAVSIPFTYSVYFRKDDTIEWAHRWDLYFVNQEEGSRIHWLSLINSFIICGVLTSFVMFILTKTVRDDIKRYGNSSLEDGMFRLKKNKTSKENTHGLLSKSADDEENADHSDEGEGIEDVTGWKLLHADVFRPPQYGFFLAPLVGSGMQLLFMALGLVLLSAVGVLNPSFRGGFISVGVGLFIFAGLFSGYFSARVFKSFDGKDYRLNSIVTATLFPGLLFILVFVLNLFVWAQASSTAIPFGTLVGILALWLCVQVPLVYAGSHYGYLKAGAWEHPAKTSPVPRPIPQQAWHTKLLQSIILAGLLPFLVIFLELVFVFQSVWQDKSGYYYVFGFMAAVSLMLIVTVAEVTMVAIYLQLSSENYHWWWQSFLVGGGSSVWIFAYSVWFYFFRLHISGFASSVLFFAYSFMACCVYGLLTGTVGFLSAYAFVRRIYG